MSHNCTVDHVRYLYVNLLRQNVTSFTSGISSYHEVNTTIIKTSKVMIFKEKVAVCSEIRTNHSTQSEHHVEFFNVKPGGFRL